MCSKMVAKKVPIALNLIVFPAKHVPRPRAISTESQIFLIFNPFTFRLLSVGCYGGPQVSRQNFLSHGKTFFLTAKHSFSRQNTLSHGKTLFLTAKHSFSRQNTLSHGKTLFLTATFSFYNQISQLHKWKGKGSKYGC